MQKRDYAASNTAAINKTNSVKSKIYKVLVTKNGVTKDYGVQAYEKTLDYALELAAKKLDVSIDNIRLARSGYEREVLETFWKTPGLLLIREKETVNEQDAKNYKLGEQAQADLNALLKHEPLKTISEGNLYIVKEDENMKRYTSTELRFRPFYSTVGTRSNGDPICVSQSEKPRVKANRAFYTDTNDTVYDDPDTILLPNTDFIVPVKVRGKVDEASLNSVFRFPSMVDAYKFVRNQIIDAGIADTPYRLNREMTYLEACDSWLAGTGVKMGNKEASEECVAKYVKDMAKVKENGKLKYPKLK